jgi:predicted nucleic acid-binding protein
MLPSTTFPSQRKIYGANKTKQELYFIVTTIDSKDTPYIYHILQI